MKAIINAKIYPVTKAVIKKGTILIDNGKIVDLGAKVAVPEGAEIIDAAGMLVTPGFIEAHGHPNMKESPSVYSEKSDINEITDPITPQVRIQDSLDPGHPSFTNMREGGFTTVCCLPGSANLIGGLGLVVKNKKAMVLDEMAIWGYEPMKFAMGENPKKCYGEKKMPMTRMGNAALMRETLTAAKQYSDKLLEAEKDPEKKVEPNFKLDNLVPVVRGERRCRFHAHRADDIVTACNIAKEFGLDFSIEHVTDGRRIAPWLAKNKIKCVVGPIHIGPVKIEMWNSSMETPAVLFEAGVDLAMTMDSGLDTWQLPFIAGLCVTRHGLAYEDALKALTINPAKILKLEDRIGSIEKGKDADLAVWTGDPLSNMSRCKYTVIDGEVYENF
ncbi:MAG: amidohydrolase [Lachnospiraceae bacterium]|nr:amidohydrolase [Lachnospiraceae bacterium]